MWVYYSSVSYITSISYSLGLIFMKGITITKKYLIYLITIHQKNFMKPDLAFKSKYITSKDVKEEMIIIR